MRDCPKDKRILIVDDNPHMTNLLSDILDVFHYKTESASNGEEALKLLRKEKFEMIITDVRMPKMTGVDLLKTIKAEFPSLPVVVISGFTTGADQKEFLDSSADAFLPKPFKVKDIEDILRNLLKYTK